MSKKNYIPPAATILSGVELVALDITTWSGGAQLKPGDVPGLESLPERAFSLGRKYLIAPERLKAFTTIRRRAQDRCLKVGTRFLGGYAVPLGDPQVLEELYQDLHKMKKEYDAEKRRLIGSLAQAVDEWVAEPEVQPFETLIRAAIPSPQRIEGQIGFRYVPITIAKPEAASSEHLEEVSAEMGSNLMGEIAQAARAIKKRFLERNAGLTRQEWTFTSATARTVEGLRAKLAGLSFLDHRIGPIVGEMDRVLSSIPRGHRLEGEPMRSLFQLLIMLSEEERMKQYGEALIAQQEAMMDLDWEEMTAGDAPTLAVAAEPACMDEPAPAAEPAPEPVVSAAETDNEPNPQPEPEVAEIEEVEEFVDQPFDEADDDLDEDADEDEDEDELEEDEQAVVAATFPVMPVMPSSPMAF